MHSFFFFPLSFLKCTPKNLGVRSPQLTDDAAAGLERGEVIVFEVQCLVVGNVLGGQHLAAGGAGGVVQFGGAGVRFPGGFLALLGFVGSLLLFQPQLLVGGQQLLLFGVVWEKHQELVEYQTEGLPEKLTAALVILRCGYQSLSELAGMGFKLIELGLVALQVILDGVDEVNVPLLEVLRLQVSHVAE